MKHRTKRQVPDVISTAITLDRAAKICCEGYADDGYSAGLFTGFREGAKWAISKGCQYLMKAEEGGSRPNIDLQLQHFIEFVIMWEEEDESK